MDNRLAVPIAVVILLLALAALIGSWISNNYERENYTRRSEMSSAARRNPLLAAERFLSRLGLETESRSGRKYLNEPPPGEGLLLVKDLGAPLPPARVNALLDWVEVGGLLVASPGLLQNDEASHLIMDMFGVTYVRGVGNEAEEPVSITLPGEEDRPLRIDFDADAWFEVESSEEYWQAPPGDTPNLLIFHWGEGQIVFLSDSDFLSNLRIGEEDHAVLLAELAADQPRAWLLYSTQMPSLWALLWRWAPYHLIGLMLLGVFLLWHFGRPAGPRLCTETGQRRDLLEHLRAAAEYSWRLDPKRGSLEVARRQVEKRWLASHPQLQRLEPRARCEWLAERTGMNMESIEQALYQGQDEGGQLIKTTAILQRLLAALHPQSTRESHGATSERYR